MTGSCCRPGQYSRQCVHAQKCRAGLQMEPLERCQQTRWFLQSVTRLLTARKTALAQQVRSQKQHISRHRAIRAPQSRRFRRSPAQRVAAYRSRQHRSAVDCHDIDLPGQSHQQQTSCVDAARFVAHQPRLAPQQRQRHQERQRQQKTQQAQLILLLEQQEPQELLQLQRRGRQQRRQLGQQLQQPRAPREAVARCSVRLQPPYRAGQGVRGVRPAMRAWYEGLRIGGWRRYALSGRFRT
jgi:hypothetical protein